MAPSNRAAGQLVMVKNMCPGDIITRLSPASFVGGRT